MRPYWGLREYQDDGEAYEGQIGNEDTPQEWLDALLDCTREWMRILKPEGSIFVNLGDAYGRGTRSREARPQSLHDRRELGINRGLLGDGQSSGMRPKSLLGLPWRYAIGCMDDLGLIMRRDIAWHKTNPMPESVTDRCRTTHEYLFHFVKQERYFTAMDEIRESHSEGTHPGRVRSVGNRSGKGVRHRTFAGNTDVSNPLGKMPGSVWEISSVPLVIPPAVAHARCCGGRPAPGCEKGLAHHAAYPPELVSRVIRGWSPSGICAECGEGRRPATVTGRETYHGHGRHRSGARQVREGAAQKGWQMDEKWAAATTITGYRCACPVANAPTRAAVIADPFGGSGTTALVASVLGRTGVTVDGSADYCRIAQWRTKDPAERARALGVPKPPPVPEGQGSLFDTREVS